MQRYTTVISERFSIEPYHITGREDIVYTEDTKDRLQTVFNIKLRYDIYDFNIYVTMPSYNEVLHEEFSLMLFYDDYKLYFELTSHKYTSISTGVQIKIICEISNMKNKSPLVSYI